MGNILTIIVYKILSFTTLMRIPMMETMTSKL